jgi:hypothetical protein
MTPLEGPAGYLTLQFLTWVAEAPRSYGDAMDAWRTSCPRLSIWDDAIRDALVRVENGRGPMRQSRVVLTGRGRTLLARHNGDEMKTRQAKTNRAPELVR